MSTDQTIPKGRWAQIFVKMKVGEQKQFDLRKGTLARNAIFRLGVSDQFTTWSIFGDNGEKIGIVVSRI